MLHYDQTGRRQRKMRALVGKYLYSGLSWRFWRGLMSLRWQIMRPQIQRQQLVQREVLMWRLPEVKRLQVEAGSRVARSRQKSVEVLVQFETKQQARARELNQPNVFGDAGWEGTCWGAGEDSCSADTAHYVQQVFKYHQDQVIHMYQRTTQSVGLFTRALLFHCSSKYIPNSTQLT